MDAGSAHNDKELFRLIADGDEAAYKTLFDTHYLKFVSYAAKILHSDLWAEEIVQDVFLKLWSIRSTLTTIDNPAGFMNRMVFNRIRDHLRHKKHEIKLQHYLLQFTESGNATQDSYDFRQGKKLFEEAVAQLPKQRAAVFKLRHEQGLSYEEIARELNISKNTVRNLLVLAVQHIRDYLLEHGGINGIIYSTIIIFITIF